MTPHRSALALACVAWLSAALTEGAETPRDFATLVNTFIGTRDDGNTFPGASAPFGLIQVSPIGSHYSGWRYDDQAIRGFGHSFISGAGCWEQGGQLSLLPVVGRIGKGLDFDTDKAESFDQKKYASTYSHEGEVGEAGYYSVRLTGYGGIDAEGTALTRAAAERYTFGTDLEEGHILVNVGQANERHSVVGSDVRVVNDHTVEGKIVTQSFCGGRQYATWFRVEFDGPFKARGVWDESGGHPGVSGPSMQGDGRPHGVWLTFDLKAGRAVTAISAISHVDAEGARKNLRADGMRGGALLSFDAMRQASQDAWRRELQSVRIEGGNRDDRSVFYTALYHALLQPLTGSDVDGRYRGYDDAIHRAEGFTYYEYFSLWDTYRAQNQWLAMMRPDRARDIATSVLKIQEQGGWLPRWGYANFETNVMTGDPVTPFLVDLWRFGALRGQEQQAYAALRQNAFGVPPAGSRHQGRAGNPSYLTRGFVQYDRAFPAKGMDVDPHHGGSATLEYALADCALSQMAASLGKGDDARVLNERGRNWRKLWDAEASDPELPFRGFPRPRLEDGSWYKGVADVYSPRSNHGFHEGTAWQYQWLVQQDVAGLMAAMGGREQTASRLDAFFAYGALLEDPLHAARKEWVVGPYSYYNQYRYNPNNEPDLHTPWMYTLIGQPWKTVTVVRAAQALFTNSPSGVTGNDDLGTMSAWYLFSAIGLYPAVPGTGALLIHTPRFEVVEMDLGGGKVLRIEAKGAEGGGVQFVEGLSFDRQSLDKVSVSWEQIRSGGTMRFTLSDKPGLAWGRSPSALPASP
ncbi:MAG: GH92 family glycosyl hydrolase, partial [Vicinamibacteria bacterium]|nr:GH92 family glycosyl hydrolase [Vicinamibacteria bacterium]